MCGRFAAPRNAEDILTELDLEWQEFSPEREVFPTNQVLAFINEDGQHQAIGMTWGWQRNFTKRPLINVRGPEAWGKRTWSEAIQTRRCVIPAASFFEWDQNQPKGKRDRYRIDLSHGKDFAMGGLFEFDPESGEYFCSILTTAPNNIMQPIHHRMPVILDNTALTTWLISKDTEVVNQLMEPIADEVTRLARA